MDSRPEIGTIYSIYIHVHQVTTLEEMVGVLFWGCCIVVSLSADPQVLIDLENYRRGVKVRDSAEDEVNHTVGGGGICTRYMNATR